MSYLNIELKAKCRNPGFVRQYLLSKGAVFKGTDEQTDTYFNVRIGRLKLREGNIENNLIFYQRADQAGPKSSDFTLLKVEDAKTLKQILTISLGVKIVVSKTREIYYIENVKFHIDSVPSLGAFVEIEAGNILADLSSEKLNEQCSFYQKELKISEEDLVDLSYSDLLFQKLI